MLQISHSELRLWRTCRRRWYLTYYLQWASDPSRRSPIGLAALGTRVHLSLEGHYGYELNALDVLKYEYKQLLEERPEFGTEITRELDWALAMVDGYLEWVTENGMDADYEVVATEKEQQQEVTLPSGHQVIFRGKLDQLVRRVQDDALLFRDFKTVGTLSKANLLVLDTQMRFYAMLQALSVQGTGKRADGGLYMMLLRSKHTDRAKGPFYEQVAVSYNSHDLNSMYHHSRAIAQEIVNARELLDEGEPHHGVVYASPSDACGWSCPFVNVCPMMDDGSRWEDALAERFVKVDPYLRYSDDKIVHISKALKGG